MMQYPVSKTAPPAKQKVTPYPPGTSVSWQGQHGISHGKILRVQKVGDTLGDTVYAIGETGKQVTAAGHREPRVTFQSGAVLKCT